MHSDFFKLPLIQQCGNCRIQKSRMGVRVSNLNQWNLLFLELSKSENFPEVNTM